MHFPSSSRRRSRPALPLLLFLLVLSLLPAASLEAQSATAPSWGGALRDAAGQPIAGATLSLSGPATSTAVTAADGAFRFLNPVAGSYTLSVRLPHRAATPAIPVQIPGPAAIVTLASDNTLALTSAPLPANAVPVQANTPANGAARGATGGEQLSSESVSQLPLNGRDFSTLLLLAAGTMTDVNGATNFTQQFAINGQRGVGAVFAMDGADTTDPEMGGAAFSNFNVDAIEEIRSSSGWMPAEIGRGAAGFTNMMTRSGKDGFHGSFFEFVRNSAFDARNYFDFPAPGSNERIPPFHRNEFGFTNGGPVYIPHLYDGRGRTYYFGQYQGFRQVLGTTQVLPMPTSAERQGLDTLTFSDGSTDTLNVPVNPQIAAVLARYPVPNHSNGAYGARTYATHSNVVTDADQFSIRIDQQIGSKGQFLARLTEDNLTGPTTNPDQTTIDPSFAVQYIDRQRNVAFRYDRTVSPHFQWTSAFSIIRTTPGFPTPNHTDPGLKFTDGLFEGFNTAAGSVMSAFGNLFQGQQDFTWIHGAHTFKFGAEARLNRDTTYFGISPNGEYDFGGGTVYSPVFIPSQSGQHNINPGDPLPDSLTSLLIGYPYSYTVAVAPPYFSNGPHIGPAAISRNDFNFYFQDTWKISPRLTLDYGLRFEDYSPITERAHRTSSFHQVDPPAGTDQQYVINPQPGYRSGWNGWGPRVQLSWRAPHEVLVHIGGGITVIPPNIWQDNFLTGSTPFAVYPRVNASRTAEIPYGFTITPDELPRTYTPAGEDVFAAAGDNPKKVPANTVMDVDRYQHDLAALSPSHQLSLLNLSAIDPRFGDGFLQTWTLGLERPFAGLTADAAYVGTESFRLPRVSFPNGFPGAEPGFAPYTHFDSTGTVIGGAGYEQVITDTAHSTYHALQTSLAGTIRHGGPGLQAGYTWSKSIDDVSAVGGGTGSSGAVVIPTPQNPFDTHPERGPSTFDVTHGFTLSAAQALPFRALFRTAPTALTNGWELLSISSINSGSPFTVYSGIQQTGVGTNGADRPDPIAQPDLSTAGSSTRRREDYFGRGAGNASYFSIPIHLPGGTGPNSGRFGTLGRNTFRGPAYYDFDYALIKSTPFGHRSSGIERTDLQFRAEFFNLFNIVNMGLPANTLKGSGFGIIGKTAGTSRQIQLSLKLIY